MLKNAVLAESPPSCQDAPTATIAWGRQVAPSGQQAGSVPVFVCLCLSQLHPFLSFHTIDDDGGFHGRVAAIVRRSIMKLALRPRNLRGGALLLIAGLCATGITSQSTVSVYLPGYSDSDWEALRGSIVHSDQAATTYTVFCAEQSPTCQIAGDLPFVFAAGQKTLSYGGAAAGEITADLHCTLAEKTAATCTGSTSFASGYHQGTISGPTQTVWTKTFSGSEVAWGVLTLTTPGPLPANTDMDGMVFSPATGEPGATPTSTSGSAMDRQARSWVAVLSAGALLTALRML